MVQGRCAGPLFRMRGAIGAALSSAAFAARARGYRSAPRPPSPHRERRAGLGRLRAARGGAGRFGPRLRLCYRDCAARRWRPPLPRPAPPSPRQGAPRRRLAPALSTDPALPYPVNWPNRPPRDPPARPGGASRSGAIPWRKTSLGQAALAPILQRRAPAHASPRALLCGPRAPERAPGPVCCQPPAAPGGAWCSGIASASRAVGPGFKSQCVHMRGLEGRDSK